MARAVAMVANQEALQAQTINPAPSFSPFLTAPSAGLDSSSNIFGASQQSSLSPPSTFFPPSSTTLNNQPSFGTTPNTPFGTPAALLSSQPAPAFNPFGKATSDIFKAPGNANLATENKGKVVSSIILLIHTANVCSEVESPQPSKPLFQPFFCNPFGQQNTLSQGKNPPPINILKNLILMDSRLHR